jgi:hypothetical protein
VLKFSFHIFVSLFSIFLLSLMFNVSILLISKNIQPVALKITLCTVYTIFLVYVILQMLPAIWSVEYHIAQKQFVVYLFSRKFIIKRIFLDNFLYLRYSIQKSTYGYSYEKVEVVGKKNKVLLIFIPTSGPYKSLEIEMNKNQKRILKVNV